MRSALLLLLLLGCVALGGCRFQRLPPYPIVSQPRMTDAHIPYRTVPPQPAPVR